MIRIRSRGHPSAIAIVDQRVLSFARFSVIADLLRRGLADVDDRQQTEVPIRDQARPGATYGRDLRWAWPPVAALRQGVGGRSHEHSCVTSLHVWRLRQLLGDDAGQCAENSFSMLDGEGHPEPLRNRVDGLPSCGAGGTTAVRDWRMTTLLAEFSAGAPGTTPPIGAAPATR